MNIEEALKQVELYGTYNFDDFYKLYINIDRTRKLSMIYNLNYQCVPYLKEGNPQFSANYGLTITDPNWKGLTHDFRRIELSFYENK